MKTVAMANGKPPKILGHKFESKVMGGQAKNVQCTENCQFCGIDFKFDM